MPTTQCTKEEWLELRVLENLASQEKILPKRDQP